MAFPTKLSQLCTPSYIYFIISILAIAISAIQNMGDNGTYALGMYSVNVTSCIMIFIIQIIYILFWTWILNLICKDGHVGIAWFLVLIPFILLFIVFAFALTNQKKKKNKR